MVRDKVLIVSSSDDEHSNVISQWLRKENLADPVLFDFHDFPLSAQMTYHNEHGSSLVIPGFGTLKEEQIAGVWWRRPQKFSFEKSIVDPKVKRFCEVNCQHAIQGFFEILGDRVVDPPFRILAADRKLFQLHIAQRCDLKVPSTCATNDPDVARDFIDSQSDGVIYKIFRETTNFVTGTTLLKPTELDSLHMLRHSPVIFQQFIEPDFDIRITIVGKDIFSAKLTSSKPDGRVDIRKDAICEAEPYELPHDIEQKIRRLISIVGLRYAAIDMRTNKKGEHYFLEINPVAQYLFVEVVTNQPITRTLARLLADPVRSK